MKKLLFVFSLIVMSLTASAQVNVFYKLGWDYLFGANGKTKDAKEAVYWFKQGADQGDADCQYFLGFCYEDGLGVEKDLQQAQALFRKAAEQGHEAAQLAINELTGEVFEIEIVDPQEEWVEDEDGQLFIVVENMPEFPGGHQALMKYISDNIKYPIIALENGIQGRVICQFIVGEDGTLENIQVVRTSGDASLDKEAVRLIDSMPKWKPGLQKGKPVRVTFTLPVTFRIQDDETPKKK